MAKKRQHRIGFLVRGIEASDSYNRQNRVAAFDLARRTGVDFVLVTAHGLEGPEQEDSAYAAVLRLLCGGLVDGALLSTTVTYRLPPERLAKLDAELEFPVVGLSSPLGRRPNVAVDNESGMAELMRHLIGKHGYRRIVHVRGPYPNEEAGRREAVWRRELKRAGIDARPEWLVPGGFTKDAVTGVGRRILDQAGTAFDAVVACNDIAAQEVIHDFRELGYRVPQDYAVCGFDDLETSRYSDPPLTTVRQSLATATELAWTELERLLDGRRARSRTVPSSLVVRVSCGCPAEPPAAEERPALIGSHEQRMEKFQSAVYGLHNFIRAMNRVADAEHLAPVLHEWLPRLGVPRFVVLQTSTADGEPAEHACQWGEGVLPTAPPYFTVLTVLTGLPALPAAVIPGDRFSLAPWFDELSPSVTGLFPLVVGSTWHGLAVFELSRDAGLIELSLQEQLASALDRVAREKRFRETETLRRFAVNVAQEITMPLAAVTSAHALIDARLSNLAEQWMPFVTSLSESGRALLSRLYAGLSLTADPAVPEGWPEALADLADPRAAAADLARLGYRGDAGELRALARSEDFERVLRFLVQLADLPSSTAMMGAAAEQISSFINALRRSLL